MDITLFRPIALLCRTDNILQNILHIQNVVDTINPTDIVMGLNNVMNFITFLCLETKKGNNVILFIIFNLNMDFIKPLRLATLYMFDKVFASFSFLIRKISKKKKKHVD
jgi:hypothetical protein